LAKRIRNTTASRRRPKKSGHALGAGERKRGHATASDESSDAEALLTALRQKLSAGLKSTGGRPALEGTDRKQKIPMADADWATVGRLARAFQADGVHATPGQVAAQLLRDAIARFGRGAAYPDESTRPRRALQLAETVVTGRAGTAVTRIDLANADLELRTARPGSPAPATAVTWIDSRGRKHAVASMVIRARGTARGEA